MYISSQKQARSSLVLYLMGLRMLRRFADCLEKGRNKEAKAIFPKLDNPCQWTDPIGSTLLHSAAFHDNAEMTQYLIDKGCNVNAKNRYGICPLMIAVKARHVKIVEILLKYNVDIYATDPRGLSILVAAAFSRLPAVFGSPAFRQDVKLILDMLIGQVNKDFSEGKLTDFLANANDFVKIVIVAIGNEEIVRFLLGNCYSIDYHEPREGLTALHCAILFAKFENAKLLMEHGADINALNYKGNTPLIFYPRTFDDVDDNLEILKIFLRDSTDLYIPDSCGLTELQYLFLRGKKKTVKTVLQSGIDLEKCVDNDKPLICLLVLNKDVEILDVLDELDIKFDVNRRDLNGVTALMIASRLGCLRKMEFLLEHGANPNLTMPTGECALSFALANHPERYSKKSRDVVKFVELLLQHGADVHIFFRYEATVVNFYPILGLKIILAHLAMLEAVKQSASTCSPDARINLKHQHKDYFDSCVEQLEMMKQFKVHGAVTLFKLLTESEDEIMRYVDSGELTSELSGGLKTFLDMEPYYVDTLQKKISRALDAASFQMS